MALRCCDAITGASLHVNQLRDKIAPALYGWRHPMQVFGTCLANMTVAAEGLQVRHVPQRAAPLQRHDMVALKFAGFAACAAPEAVAPEHGAPDCRPPATAQADLTHGYRIAYKTRALAAAHKLLRHRDARQK